MADSKKVTQRRLAVLMAKRELVKEHQKEADRFAKEVGDMEREVMSMLLDGADVEPGKWSAGMEAKLGNCTPKWKELYIEHMTMEHEEPAVVVEARAKALYPAAQKTVLVVVAKTGKL